VTDEAPVPDPSERSVSRIAALQSSARVRSEQATAWASRMRERSVIIEAIFVVYERDRISAGSVLGSAIAFRLFLFFVPTVVFGVGLIGVIAGYVDPDTVTETASLTGALADQIRSALSQSTTAAYISLLTGLFLMLTAGRTLAKALVASSSLAWLTGGKVTAKVKVVATIIGIVTSLTLASMVINKIRVELGGAVVSLSFGVIFVIYVVLLILLMSALPRRTPDPGALLPGAVLASLVLIGMQAISQLYLPDRLSGASELYGGIGVAIVTLGWLFIVGRTLALAFSANAALFDRFGSLSQPIFALPVLRALPRRSRSVRRYFGLDADGRSVRRSAPDRDPVVIDDELLAGIETLSAVDGGAADGCTHTDLSAQRSRRSDGNGGARPRGEHTPRPDSGR